MQQDSSKKDRPRSFELILAFNLDRAYRYYVEGDTARWLFGVFTSGQLGHQPIEVEVQRFIPTSVTRDTVTIWFRGDQLLALLPE